VETGQKDERSWYGHPIAKDVKNVGGLPLFPVLAKLTDLSFVIAMSELNLDRSTARLFRTYKAPEYQSA